MVFGGGEVHRAVIGGVVEGPVVVEDDDFSIASGDPFVVVVVDKHGADINATEAATQVVGAPDAVAIHHRKGFDGACVGHPEVAFAVEGQAADVDEVVVLHPVVKGAVVGVVHLFQHVVFEFQDAITPGADVGDSGIVGVGGGTDEIGVLVEIGEGGSVEDGPHAVKTGDAFCHITFAPVGGMTACGNPYLVAKSL